MEQKLTELKKTLLEINDINSAMAVLSWDQSTYMPSGGAPARGRQMSTLGRIAHEKFTSDKVGHLLADLKPLQEELGAEHDDAALLRVTQKNYDRLTKIPGDLYAAFTQHSAASYQAWTQARPANDFATMQPLLEKTLDFSRKIAECFPGHDHIADPLISFSDEGMKAESVRVLFAELRDALVPLVKAIGEQEEIDDSILKQHYPEAEQRAFGEAVIKQYGYDFNRGRQDKTHHPFMTKFSGNDVRITTRFDENELGDGLFSTLHEAGHALYELGVNSAYDGTPLGGGVSAGVHESQSRLWENIVGRSLGFWTHYYPALQNTFPEQLGNTDVQTFYRAINKVKPSLIRVDADEVTYNLHVMIRFELALQLLEGSLAVKDLPEAWHARYASDLGSRAEDDKDGVLQDVHWYAGIIGGSFQGYTLGNIISGAFYAKALEAQPQIPADIERGEFSTLHNWLKDNIYQYGSKYTPDELIQRVTGSGLTITPYMDYLKGKFGKIYNL